VIQAIIQYNKSKEPKYGTPEGCTTGILENSEELQTIIEKDWKKLEQFCLGRPRRDCAKAWHDNNLRFGIQVNSLIVI
jgi:hypothetical protein